MEGKGKQAISLSCHINNATNYANWFWFDWQNKIHWNRNIEVVLWILHKLNLTI